jgi:sodium/potassium-transporting ATPase subunit alpha
VIFPDFAKLEWHTISVGEIYARLSTGVQGLSREQLALKTKHFGRNVLSSSPSQWAKKTFLYLFGGFGSILFVTSILVFVSWKPLGEPPLVANLALGIVLAIVWVIQAMFSFFQGVLSLKSYIVCTISKLLTIILIDWSTSRVMASIKNMLPDDCSVIREGTQQIIRSTDIVPGDLLIIRSGDKLPADVRFVQVSTDVKFDRSVLTGE